MKRRSSRNAIQPLLLHPGVQEEAVFRFLNQPRQKQARQKASRVVAKQLAQTLQAVEALSTLCDTPPPFIAYQCNGVLERVEVDQAVAVVSGVKGQLTISLAVHRTVNPSPSHVAYAMLQAIMEHYRPAGPAWDQVAVQVQNVQEMKSEKEEPVEVKSCAS